MVNSTLEAKRDVTAKKSLCCVSIESLMNNFSRSEKGLNLSKQIYSSIICSQNFNSHPKLVESRIFFFKYKRKHQNDFSLKKLKHNEKHHQ